MFVSIIALIIFFLGLAFISRNNYKNIEGFDNIDKRTCGTMLIQKGQKLYRKAKKIILGGNILFSKRAVE